MEHTSTISFPGLGIGPFEVSNIAFKIFGFEIAWYAVIICLGMIAAVAYVIYRAGKIGINSDEIMDFAIFTIPIGVLGARLYYVIMELESFIEPSILETFVAILNIRDGGLAIYGGIIAGAITVLVICKVKKINFFAFADCVVPGLILAQAIGRWGNFMNGEAFGGLTSNNFFLRMGIDNANSQFVFNTAELVYVHPTFLYESLWNLIGFTAINFFYKHKKYDGQIFFMIFGWYGLGRMWIEGLRTDSLYIGDTGIRVSQLLAFLIFITCTVFLIYFAIKRPKKELYIMPPKPEKAKKNNVNIKNDSTATDNTNSNNKNDISGD